MKEKKIKKRKFNFKGIIFITIIIVIFIFSLIFDKQIFYFLDHSKEKISNLKLQTLERENIFYPLLLVLGAIFIFFDKKKGKKGRKFLIFLLSFGIAVLIVLLLKIVIARPRPDQSFSSFIDNSFPSGHSTAVFVLLPFLENKSLKIIWTIFAILISISRIWIGPHYLSDILAGFLIGFIIPTIILKIFKK